MKRTRILVIEDNRIFRDGITAVINKQPDLVIVAAASGHRDALVHVGNKNVHVVLVDLGLQSENALRVVAALTRELPHVKVIGMGLIPSQQDIIEFVQAGAAGFVLKDARVDEVLGTIRAVAGGMRILPPILMGSLFTHVVDHALRDRKTQARAAVRMTKREREIIILIADALSNKEIAERLHLSTYTVKSHIHNILEKLALQSRLEISAYSRRVALPSED
jgi:DNA-binding NarL/FixJ family response regulator